MEYKHRPTSNDQLYEMVIKEDDNKIGVYAVGLVQNPAIEINWVALNTDNKYNTTPVLLNDEKGDYKYTLTGPLMVPEQQIYRSNFGGEYWVKFSAEVIRRAQEMFFKSGFNDRITHQHQIPLFSNTVIESQIIENEQFDKSKHYGFDLPVGTQMITVKIDDKEYQNNEVLMGKVQGFSLEGLFEHVELPNNLKDEPIKEDEAPLTNNEMAAHKKEKRKKRKSLKSMFNNFIKKMLKLEAETPEAVSEMAATIILEFMINEQMVEVDEQLIMTYAESGEIVPAGVYDATNVEGTMEQSIEVLEEGKVAMFKTAWGKEAGSVEEESAETTETPTETEMEKMSKEIVAMSSMIKNLNDELSKMKSPISKKIEVTKKVDNFSTQEKPADDFGSVLNKFIKNKK